MKSGKIISNLYINNCRNGKYFRIFKNFVNDDLEGLNAIAATGLSSVFEVCSTSIRIWFLYQHQVENILSKFVDQQFLHMNFSIVNKINAGDSETLH